MNTSTYFSTGDVVNITLTKAAWPFDPDVYVPSLILQGRVIYADALGIAMVDGGGGSIMPRSRNSDFIEHVDQNSRGNFYPWHSVDAISLVCRSADYAREIARASE